ncbi:MAG: hypothetical protein FOGNACKC_01371 [Anaerolineae bacterium]|nr:hypothetical protein [Anaerolineae bacterium]
MNCEHLRLLSLRSQYRCCERANQRVSELRNMQHELRITIHNCIFRGGFIFFVKDGIIMSC